MENDKLLFELEEYIKNLWSFLPVPVIYVTKKGVVMDVNESFLKKFKLNRLSVINENITNILPIKSVKQLIKLNNKELRINDLTFIISVQEYINVNKELIGYFISFSDITKQQLAEELLKNEKSKLNVILSSIGDCLVVINNKGIITQFNKKASEVTGYKSSEVIGKKYDRILRFYFENGKKNEFIKEALRGETREMGENTMLKRRDGSMIYVADSISKINNKLFNGLVIVFRDVTNEVINKKKLIESEFRYHSLFDNATELIQSVDTKGRIIDVNKAWCDTMGYTYDEAIKLRITDYFDESCSKRCFNLFKEVINGKKISNIKATFKKKNGEKVIVEGSATPIIKNGKIIGTWGIFTNITELIKTRELLIKKEKNEAINELRNEFFMRVSHELRHPLVAIIGYSSVMLEENPSDIQRKYLEKILLSGNQLKRLINRIIEVTSLQSGESKLNLKLTNLKELINELLIDFITPIELKELRLVKKLSNIKAMIDEKRIKEALINIIDNAVQFTNKGEIRITLRKENNNAVIIISDTGKGMTNEELSELNSDIINPEIGRKKYTHLRLGYYLSKIIIELHGGKIRLQSKKGKGTKVIITLPIKR